MSISINSLAMMFRFLCPPPFFPLHFNVYDLFLPYDDNGTRSGCVSHDALVSGFGFRVSCFQWKFINFGFGLGCLRFGLGSDLV
jgi:hypothetical protein